MKHTLINLIIGISVLLSYTKILALEEKDYKAMLDHHNKLRSALATGRMRGYPPASNMAQLQYNEELAQKAQAWANLLGRRCSGMQHNSDKTSKSFKYVGENIYTSMTTGQRSSVSQSLLDGSVEWYKEIRFCPINEVYRFTNRGRGGVIGHYTQQIWAESTDIGCGYSECRSGGWNTVFTVCNYGPGGNMMGDPIYQAGQACTRCQSGFRCSSEFQGLCVRKQATESLTMLSLKDELDVTTPREGKFRFELGEPLVFEKEDKSDDSFLG